jgi:hypothetical protein
MGGAKRYPSIASRNDGFRRAQPILRATSCFVLGRDETGETLNPLRQHNPWPQFPLKDAALNSIVLRIARPKSIASSWGHHFPSINLEAIRLLIGRERGATPRYNRVRKLHVQMSSKQRL